MIVNIIQWVAAETVLALTVVALLRNLTAHRTLKACLLTVLITTVLLTYGDPERSPVMIIIGTVSFVSSYAAARAIFHKRINAAEAIQTPSRNSEEDIPKDV